MAARIGLGVRASCTTQDRIAKSPIQSHYIILILFSVIEYSNSSHLSLTGPSGQVLLLFQQTPKIDVSGYIYGS